MKEKPYIKLYEHIKGDKNLDLTERLIYNLIYNFTEDGKSCFISNQYIANDLQIDISKVKRSLKVLLDKKYITITKYTRGNIKRSINRYDLKTVKNAENGAFEGCSWYLVYKI